MHPIGIAAPLVHPSPIVQVFSLAQFEATLTALDCRSEQAHSAAPFNQSDFERSIRRWLPYVKPRFHPFIGVWSEAIVEKAKLPVSPSSLKTLRGMMRRDVKASAEELARACPQTLAIWTAFYPKWVAQLIEERCAIDPLFLLPAEEHARQKSAKQTTGDTARKRTRRDRELCVRLVLHLQSNGGMVHWSPTKLAEAISAKGGGPRVDAKRLRSLAEALVSLDVALWCWRASGQPWALQLKRQRCVSLH